MMVSMIVRVMWGVLRLMVLSSTTRVGYGGAGVDGVEVGDRQGEKAWGV